MGRDREVKLLARLLAEFFKIGNRAFKSISRGKRTEKMLNLFLKAFFNLVRSFWYNTSHPKYDSIKEIASPEWWKQLFLSAVWANKFMPTNEINSHPCQFLFEQCNFLMTQFSCLSTILQAYGRILSEETERSLESLFNYSCLPVHKEAGTSKYLWTLMITHFANLGEDEEAKWKRSENLDDIERFLNSLSSFRFLESNVWTLGNDEELDERRWLENLIGIKRFLNSQSSFRFFENGYLDSDEELNDEIPYLS